MYRLPDGRYRLFFPGCQPANGPPLCGVLSAISTDGLTFTTEPGLRLPRFFPYIQGRDPVRSTIIKLTDGRYRMYCSQQVTPDIAPNIPGSGHRAIFSAVSTDLFNWAPEPGIRIGPGAPSITGDADHPTAVANPDGSITLIYDGFVDLAVTHEQIATSQDGLTFDSESDTGLVGTEPSLVRLGDGSLFLYYGEHTADAGSTINVARVYVNRLLTATVHGHGSVTSVPAGISCPTTCSASFRNGQMITLRGAGTARFSTRALVWRVYRAPALLSPHERR